MALYCFRVTNGAAEPQEGVTLVFASNPMLDLVQTNCATFPLKNNGTPTILTFRSSGNAIHVPLGGVVDVTLVCAGTIPSFNTYWWNAPVGPDSGTRRTSISCTTMAAAPGGSLGVLWAFSKCEAADPGTINRISDLRLFFYDSDDPQPDPKDVERLITTGHIGTRMQQVAPTPVGQMDGGIWDPVSRTIELPPGGGVLLRAQYNRQGRGKYAIAVAAGVESWVGPVPDPIPFAIADLAPGQAVDPPGRPRKDQDT